MASEFHDFSLIFLGNSDAWIGYGDPDGLLIVFDFFGFDCDEAFLGVLESILQQVEKNL